jgi:RNA-directed DNA polymerase
VDHVTVSRFASRLEANLEDLSQGLREGRYRPQAVRRVLIPKPGGREKRPLGVPTVRDRVVQGALRHVLEPIFERDFAQHSYGFRPKRNAKDALRRVTALLDAGYTHVVDADIASYFDTIPHEQLMARIGEKVSDGKVLSLVSAFLDQGVLESGKEWVPDRGTPQGAVLSPLLSNIYLDPLDQRMAQLGYEMVRYADDFVILCRSSEEAQKALAEVQEWTAGAGLSLHPEKTQIVDATQEGGFDFLGYHFERGMRWPRKKSLKKLRARLRELTPRCNGNSLQAIVKRINPTLRGWFEYFKHSHETTFKGIDGWVRGRLRSILRKRRRGKGRARGADHQRWPNEFFGEHGLFSLVEAHALAVSLHRSNHRLESRMRETRPSGSVGGGG